MQWTREGRFGIEFVSLVPEEWTRLQHTVTQLELHPSRRSRLTHIRSSVIAIDQALLSRVVCLVYLVCLVCFVSLVHRTR